MDKMKRKEDLENQALKEYVASLGVSWETVIKNGLEEEEVNELRELYVFFGIPHKF